MYWQPSSFLERVCQVQTFAVLCKDWKNHSSVYTYLSFQRKSCSKDSCDNFLLYLCIIWDQRSKVFNSWQTFKGCPPRNMLGLFRFAEYLALWSIISVLSTDTFNPNQRQTSEKICTVRWRCSSSSEQREVSSAKKVWVKTLFLLWILTCRFEEIFVYSNS